MEKFNQPDFVPHATTEDYLRYGEDEEIVGRINNAAAKGNFGEVDELKAHLEGRISIIKDYEGGTTPTYASYANILDELLTKTEGIDDGELAPLRALAGERVREIRLAVRRYVDKVVRYHRIKKQLQHDENFSKAADYERIDHERRATHNALIETLLTTGQTIAKLRDILREHEDTDVLVQAYPSQSGDKGGNLLFDKAFLDDRDNVRNWAIAAWTIEQIRKAKEKAAQ